jgi:hypothetical protein
VRGEEMTDEPKPIDPNAPISGPASSLVATFQAQGNFELAATLEAFGDSRVVIVNGQVVDTEEA